MLQGARSYPENSYEAASHHPSATVAVQPGQSAALPGLWVPLVGEDATIIVAPSNIAKPLAVLHHP